MVRGYSLIICNKKQKIKQGGIMFLQFLLAKTGINISKSMIKKVAIKLIDNFSPRLAEKFIDEATNMLDQIEKPLLIEVQALLLKLKNRVSQTPNIIDDTGYRLLQKQLKKMGENLSKIADSM